MTTSLERLQVPSVKILYLHAPDHETPLKETLKTVDSLHKEGKFEEFGLSNFSALLVAEVVNQCKQNQWVLPTVYQVRFLLRTPFVNSKFQVGSLSVSEIAPAGDMVKDISA